MEEKRENKALIVSYSRALGYDKGEVKCLLTLWSRESPSTTLLAQETLRANQLAQLSELLNSLESVVESLNYKSYTAYDTLVTATEGVRVALSHIATDEAGTDV